MPEGKTLDMGCGPKSRPNTVRVDRLPFPGVDVVHDLDTFPYPFEDDEFSEVICSHVLEHLRNQVQVMEELHRITRPDGRVRIWVPYFASPYSFCDPTHVVHHTFHSFDYFVEGRRRSGHNYTSVRFRVLEHELLFTRKWGLGAILARVSMHRYEKYYSRLLPANGIHVELQPIK